MSYVFSVPVYVYDVSQRFEEVSVKYVDGGVLIIRRGLGVPKEAVAGRADVVVGLDELGRVVNVEIDFADYCHISREDAQRILRKARW
ncbi:MAG: hypothetical protein ACO2O1_02710 [Candidatus Caldarchaeales archaeon]|jgi:hypothetical protein